VIVGRIYEIDTTKYEEYRKTIEARREDSDVEPEPLGPDEFLVRVPDPQCLCGKKESPKDGGPRREAPSTFS
jgi:hypothetical protein